MMNYYAIEVVNNITGEASWMEFDSSSGGYPYFTDDACRSLHYSLVHMRKEFEDMKSANLLKMGNGRLILPHILRQAGDISLDNTKFDITVSLLSVSVISLINVDTYVIDRFRAAGEQERGEDATLRIITF